MLRAAGFVRLGQMLSTAEVADIHAFLKPRQAIDYFDHTRVFRSDAIPSDVRMASYSIETIYACPPLLRFANDPSILEVIGNYLGCKPTLSSIGLRWSFPDPRGGRGIQAFHRDTEDWRFVKLFLYLTDVDETAGPHVFVAGSHRTRGTVFMKHLKDREVEKEYGADKIVTFTGPAGEAFIADTYGIHKGVAPTALPRLILQVQYSVLPCFAFIYGARQRLTRAGVDRYVNRLFVE
jgi:hypothetical protein